MQRKPTDLLCVQRATSSYRNRRVLRVDSQNADDERKKRIGMRSISFNDVITQFSFRIVLALRSIWPEWIFGPPKCCQIVVAALSTSLGDTPSEISSRPIDVKGLGAVVVSMTLRNIHAIQRKSFFIKSIIFWMKVCFFGLQKKVSKKTHHPSHFHTYYDYFFAVFRFNDSCSSWRLSESTRDVTTVWFRSTNWLHQ